MLAKDILGKSELFVTPPLEYCLTGLEQVVPIYSLSVAVLPTAKEVLMAEIGRVFFTKTVRGV